MARRKIVSRAEFRRLPSRLKRAVKSIAYRVRRRRNGYRRRRY